MSGIFGGGRSAPTQAQKDAEAAQARADERATAQERRKCRVFNLGGVFVALVA